MPDADELLSPEVEVEDTGAKDGQIFWAGHAACEGHAGGGGAGAEGDAAGGQSLHTGQLLGDGSAASDGQVGQELFGHALLVAAGNTTIGLGHTSCC